MKRGNKSTGRPLRPVDFPELEKVKSTQPVEESRSARRMFGFHKNMHSPGFYMGGSQVAARYMEKAIFELKKKQRGMEPQSGTRPPEPDCRNSEVLDMTPAHSRELRASTPITVQVKPQPIELEKRHFPDHPKFQSLTPVARPTVPKASASIPSILSKHLFAPRNDSSAVHELASLQVFQSQKFTKMNPKVHCDNPITGLRSESMSPYRNRGMGGYGSILVGQQGLISCASSDTGEQFIWLLVASFC